MKERMESGNEGSSPPAQPTSRVDGIKKWLGNKFAGSQPTASEPDTHSGLPDGDGGQLPPVAVTPPDNSRTFGGLLPEGSIAQPLNADTKTHVEYGEKTWTTGQTVRDILQNHLDANTQQFFDKLVSDVVDTDRLSERSGRGFDEFSYDLYRFRKSLGSFSEEAEKEMLAILNRHIYSVPIRQELVGDDGKIRLDALKQAITPIEEVLPAVTYEIVDANAPEGQNNHQSLTYEQLQDSQFLERREPGHTSEGFRYQIVGMKIEDEGRGFDAKLSAFYKTTKRGQKHLRGKYGEGVKMSETHLLRNGASVKMRSRFEINGGQRVVVENGVVGYFDYPEDGKGDLTLFKKSLDSLTPIGSIDGKPVYHLGDKLFVHYDFPKGSLIKSEATYNDHTYVMYGDQLLDFAKYSFGPYQFFSNPLVIDNGGFVMKINKFSSNVASNLQGLEVALQGMHVTSPEQKSGEGIRVLEGVVETPFPSDYGIDEWDKPVRVFQDIVQNHLDASPTSKVGSRFEVEREGQRIWINEQDMTDSDIIVGFSVYDNGDGYTPNDLGTIGKSSKKSPLFAGKYGEGQKMIAAAAVRNGLELNFSSVADYNGARYRWQGSVGTRPEEIIINGTPTNVDRVVFNVTSNPQNVGEGYTSSTIIRLPAGAAPDTKVWQEWLEVIDPRIKDQFGEGGLARYVIPMRTVNNEQIIDMGYMRILLDRPGEVYENGLLVSANGGTALGYDVPEVVTTRERNAFDSSRLNEYIATALYTCPDPALAATLMQKFKEQYLDDVVKSQEGLYISEHDINFGYLYSSHFRDFVPAKPYWRQAYNAQLGTYLVYSEEAMQSNIRYRVSELTASYTRPERKEEIVKEIEQSYAALANVGHVPSDHIIHAGSNDQYAYWSRLFPTVAEYIMNLSEQEIPVTDDIHRSLEASVSASSQFLATTQNNLLSTDEGRFLYDTTVAKREANGEIEEQFSYWTPEQLQQHPERVFVAPANAGYLGLATRDRIGLNEGLLVGATKDIAGVTRHELIHKIYGLRDYSPEFITMLIESAKANIPTATV